MRLSEATRVIRPSAIAAVKCRLRIGGIITREPIT